MKKRINMGGEFYMADFGYFSMSVYISFAMSIPKYTFISSPFRLSPNIFHSSRPVLYPQILLQHPIRVKNERRETHAQ